MTKSKLSCAILLLLSTLITITLTACSPKQSESQSLTQGEAVKLLLNAADFYNPKLNETDVTKDFGDTPYNEKEPVTTAEFAVLISRAFGTLPTPIGDNLRSATNPIDTSDFPDWGKTDAENIANSRIWLGYNDSTVDWDLPVTLDNANRTISDLYALFGTNLKDDFYHTINKEYLDKSVILPGLNDSGTFNDVEYINNERISKIIKELTNTEQADGSKEQKIADFYKSAADMATRDKLGFSPIKPYIDAIDEAENYSALWAANKRITEELGIPGLINVELYTSLAYSSQYDLYVSGFYPSISKELYASSPDFEKQLKQVAVDILTLTGATAEDAQKQADIFITVDKELAESQMNLQDYSNPEKIHNVYDMDEFQAFFPTVDVKDVISTFGYKPVDEIVVVDTKLFDTYTKMFTPERFSELKSVLKTSVLIYYSPYLSSDFKQINTAYLVATEGSGREETVEQAAENETRTLFGDYVGELYVKQYFSEEAKTDIMAMVKSFIDVYKTRILALDWMSDATKQQAVKKLDTMKIEIGYPDVWKNLYENVEINDDDLFGNVAKINKAKLADLASKQGKTVERTGWTDDLPVFEVNAGYMLTINGITFPAGIFQGEFYDINAPKEKNLAAIGMVIAHEISHAFDNNGAKFDENGNVRDWWTEEDYSKFQKLCQGAITLFDGKEFIPGLVSNGTQTLGENIADMGGISVALAVAESTIPNVDYKTFFESNATMWRLSRGSRARMEYILSADVHSPCVLRANVNFQNIDKFYEVYNIKEGDGMYLAPEKRVQIW
jgi:putative endopeptidase